MRTETLAKLFLEEIHDVRSVENQIVDAVSRIANGVSAQGLYHAVIRILRTTEQHIARLDRVLAEIGPAENDETICSPSLANRLSGEIERTQSRAAAAVPQLHAGLTAREVEVLRLIAEGYATKQIADALAISLKTAEKHRQRMMSKLDLHDIAGVTRYAIAAGFVPAVA